MKIQKITILARQRSIESGEMFLKYFWIFIFENKFPKMFKSIYSNIIVKRSASLTSLPLLLRRRHSTVGTGFPKQVIRAAKKSGFFIFCYAGMHIVLNFPGIIPCGSSIFTKIKLNLYYLFSLKFLRVFTQIFQNKLLEQFIPLTFFYF